MLLGATDRAIRLVERFPACFIDRRKPELVEHLVATLVEQRVVGIALGYEDINDHDELHSRCISAPALTGIIQSVAPMTYCFS